MTAYRDLSQIPLFRYGLIKADPPWRFQSRGEPGDRAAASKYQTMPIDKIKALPVGSWCGANAVLWLWTTTSMIDQAFEVIDAWGFRFVTMGFWVKTTKSEPIRPAIGTGHVLREAGEPFLIAKVGLPEFTDKGVPGVFFAPRPGEHSEKPDEAYELAARLAPRGYAKLDLFSRRTRLGWDAAGDEAGKFDEEKEDG